MGLRVNEVGASAFQPVLALGRSILPVQRLAFNDATDLSHMILGQLKLPAKSLELGSMLWMHSMYSYTNSATTKTLLPVVTPDPLAVSSVPSFGQQSVTTSVFAILAQACFVTAVGPAGNLRCQNTTTSISGASPTSTAAINRPINTDIDNYINFMANWTTGTDRTGEQITLEHWSVVLFP